MTKREIFLKDNSARIAFERGCLKYGLDEVLEAEANSGKPVLTETNINRHIKIRELIDEDLDVLLLDCSRDFKKYVHDHFTMSKMQQELVDGMSNADLKLLKSFFEELIKDRYKSFRVLFAAQGEHQTSGCLCLKLGWAQLCYCMHETPYGRRK